MSDKEKNRFVFTQDRINKAVTEAGKRQSFFRDEKQPGLGLRVSDSAKSFIFESGKSGRITIGDVRTWDVEKARERARELMRLVDRGLDPRLVKAAEDERQAQERVASRRKTVLFGEVWASYVIANKGKWGAPYRELHDRMSELGGNPKKRGAGATIAGPIAGLMPLTLPELTPAWIAAWMKLESSKRATSARQSYRMLTAFYNWCESEDAYKGLIPAESFSAKKVKDSVPKAKAKKDCLQREHLVAWFRGVQQLESVVMSCYLQVLLLTGARRRELAGLKWEDVNFRFGGSMTLRDKGETSGEFIGTRTIPMTPYVATLIESLPRRNDYVFSSPKAEAGYIISPNKTHQQMLKKAGLPHVSLHGLRRSFKTLCQWIELPVGITDQIMGHAPQGVGERHYTVRPLDMLRMYHERIEVWFLNAAKGIETKLAPVIKLVA